MMKITSSIVVKGTPREVFPWIADPAKAARWQSEVSSWNITSGKPVRAGTTFTEVIGDGEGKLEVHGVITAYDPDRRIAFNLDSRVHRLDVDYEVMETEGFSRVIASINIRWKFPMNVVSLFTGRKMQREILGQLKAELAELKNLCGTGVEG